MVTERIIIPPRRDEIIVDTNGVSQPRFINYLEEITTEVQEISNDIINLEGSTTVVVSGTYQSDGNQTIICDGIATITLDPSATDNTKVSITRTNGEVTVTAIALINNSAEDIILSRDYVSLDFVFVDEAGSWYIT